MVLCVSFICVLHLQQTCNEDEQCVLALRGLCLPTVTSTCLCFAGIVPTHRKEYAFLLHARLWCFLSLDSDILTVFSWLRRATCSPHARWVSKQHRREMGLCCTERFNSAYLVFLDDVRGVSLNSDMMNKFADQKPRHQLPEAPRLITGAKIEC